MEEAQPSPQKKEKGFSNTASWSYSSSNVPIHHLSFSRTSNEIAVSQWDGKVHILSAQTGRISYTIDTKQQTIVSCSKFHPNSHSHLLSCLTSGTVGLYKIADGSCDWSITEQTNNSGQIENNNCYSCDFSSDSSTFAVVGSDAIIRIYDGVSFKNVLTLSKDTPESTLYHTTRIYSTIYDPKNPSILFTGGWDTRVFMWDIRSGKGIISFGGPNICGDSIDIDTHNNILLTGSWRRKAPLEFWDIRTGNLMKQGEWSSSLNQDNDICQIYSAKFIKQSGNNPNAIVAGGSDCNNVKLFNIDLKPTLRLGFFKETINSIAVSPDGNKIVIGSQDGHCQAFSYQ